MTTHIAPLASPIETPRFVTGSTLGHILRMTGMGAIGLMAIFAGDLANILFLSRYADAASVAAVGYASSLQFLTTSIAIGLAITASSLVSRALGARRRDEARRLSTSIHVAAFAISTVIAGFVFLFVPQILAMLGAKGGTLDMAIVYQLILTPTLPLLAIGLVSSGVLRAAGDPRRAMMVTLTGAIANTAFDVGLIVMLGWGIEGAAIATALSRLGICGIGIYGVVRGHGLLDKPDVATAWDDRKAVLAVAIPAMLTNIATPVSNAYVTYAIAPFGDSAVAGWAILGRVTPVAFGAIFALSGAVGPIIGQNYGAGDRGRIVMVLNQAFAVTAAFTFIAWVVLAVSADSLAAAFNADQQTAGLIVFFCRWLAPFFVFLGLLFVANAAFNTLGHAHYSTALNWGRATAGTVPFVLIGGYWCGPAGVLAGNMIGGILFGSAAAWLAYRLVNRLMGDHPHAAAE